MEFLSALIFYSNFSLSSSISLTESPLYFFMILVQSWCFSHINCKDYMHSFIFKRSWTWLGIYYIFIWPTALIVFLEILLDSLLLLSAYCSAAFGLTPWHWFNISWYSVHFEFLLSISSYFFWSSEISLIISPFSYPFLGRVMNLSFLIKLLSFEISLTMLGK